MIAALADAVLWPLLGLLGAGGLGAVMWLLGNRNGSQKANSDAKDADYENADEIRRRVSVDRAERMRSLDDAGYRD